MKSRSENKGFSLVELVVTIAIFSIVSIVIGSFLVASSRAYSVSANELDIQEEAQLVANQIQEMVLDTAIGISYKYIVTDESGTELNDYMNNDLELPTGDTSRKELWIYGKDGYNRIHWNKEKNELYLTQYVKISTGGFQLADGMTEDGVILGEYVADFSVDLSEVASNRMVAFDICFKKPNNDRDYLVSRTVSLRNNVLTNRNKEEVYNAAGLEFEPVPDSLTVTPGYDSVWPGEEVAYNVTLTCSRGGVPSQSVNWALSSGDGVALAGNTGVTAGGILKVSSDEKSSLINVTASATGYDYTNAKSTVLSKDLTVAVKQIKSLAISNNDFETSPVSAGGSYQFDVTMTGSNISSLTLDGENGLNAYVSLGSSYASVTKVEPKGNLKATVTVQIDAKAPQGTKIGVIVTPKRAAFSDVIAATGVYTVGGKGEIFKISSGSGSEWLRLGAATTNVTFVSDDKEKDYCNKDGSLKTGYFIKYIYDVYDNRHNQMRTAYRTTGAGNGNDYTDYFSASGKGNTFSSVVNMTDEVFLTSGTVYVQAILMYKTSGAVVEVGRSDLCTYIIPEAEIEFRRTSEETGVSNLKSYITEQDRDTSVYISFASGFATDDYNIYRNKMTLSSDELGTISSVDTALRKVVISGNTLADYDTHQTLTFTYGDLSSKVTIGLEKPNVAGTDYYVPVNKTEWVQTNEKADTAEYQYCVDDTHKMYIKYVNGTFDSAVFYALESLNWTNKGSYTLDVANKRWTL